MICQEKIQPARKVVVLKQAGDLEIATQRKTKNKIAVQIDAEARIREMDEEEGLRATIYKLIRKIRTKNDFNFDGKQGKG